MIDPYIMLVIISILPWIELRGAIPLGIIVFGLDPISVFLVSVLANITVYFPIHLGLTYGYNYFKRFWFIEKLVNRIRDRSGSRIKKYGLYGLASFVAIPLPVTGAWSGTLIAWLLGLDRKKSFFAIAAGVTVAGIIVTLLSLFAVEALYLLGINFS